MTDEIRQNIDSSNHHGNVALADPYSILKGWIAYAEECPLDRDAQELRKLSEACLAKLIPYRDMGQLGSK